jgi:hypothetical protein
VEDLTITGAGLHVPSTFGLPRVFRLTIDGEVGSNIAGSFGRTAGSAYRLSELKIRRSAN